MKIGIIFRQGWLGILLACIALIDALTFIKGFVGARFFIYALLTLSKRHDRILNLEIYLTGSFFVIFVVACVLNKPADLLLTAIYLLSLCLVFAYLSVWRLRQITRHMKKNASDING